MTRELPSIPKPETDVVTVPVHIHTEYVTSTEIIEAVGDKIQAGVTVGGSVVFAFGFDAVPIVTAVPEVL